MRTPSFSVQILSFSCSFWENLAKSYVVPPPHLESWRPLLEEILDRPLNRVTPMEILDLSLQNVSLYNDSKPCFPSRLLLLTNIESFQRSFQLRIQDFPEVGAPTLRGGHQHMILPNFPKILLSASATNYHLANFYPKLHGTEKNSVRCVPAPL